MTPDIFERCANLLAVDSSFFTVNVEAETFKENRLAPNRDTSEKFKFGSSLAAENITGSRSKRFIVELDKAADGYCSVIELEQYSP